MLVIAEHNPHTKRWMVLVRLPRISIRGVSLSYDHTSTGISFATEEVDGWINLWRSLFSMFLTLLKFNRNQISSLVPLCGEIMKNPPKDYPTSSSPTASFPVQDVKSHCLAPRLLAGWVVASSDPITSDAL